MAEWPASSANAEHEANAAGDGAFSALWSILAPPVFGIVAVLTILWSDSKTARHYVVTGCGPETFTLLLGAAYRRRIFPGVALWALLLVLHLAYAISTSSWLLRPVFACSCWSCLICTCLYQFSTVGCFARWLLRRFIRSVHFVDDKIVAFNVPALEIDRDVPGLFLVRALTFSLSTLTLEAHGIELGLRIVDEVELALKVDRLTCEFFRYIDVGDIYANVKGEDEMSFTGVDPDKVMYRGHQDLSNDAIFSEHTPILKAAKKMVQSEGGHSSQHGVRAHTVEQHYSTVKLTPLPLAEDTAERRLFNLRLREIRSASLIERCRAAVQEQTHAEHMGAKDMRAAVCARLHQVPTIAHPPQRAVKVSRLQHLPPTWFRHLFHRLPMIIRAILYILSAWHEISFSAITAFGTGREIYKAISTKIFDRYSQASAELRHLEKELQRLTVSTQYSFAGETTNMTAWAQIPLDTRFPIRTGLKFSDVIGYYISHDTAIVGQMVRMAGADATFAIPTYLLPHHEHRIPPKADAAKISRVMKELAAADGEPEKLHMKRILEQITNDQTIIEFAFHFRLPAWFSMEVFELSSALIKASKIIDMKEQVAKEGLSGDEVDEEHPHAAKFRQLADTVRHATKSGVARTKGALITGVQHDWVAKLVARISRKLEGAEGDAGWSGDIPVALSDYRASKPSDRVPKLLA